MISLTPKNWQQFNQLALDIHKVNSRDELRTVVTQTIPTSLGMERAHWCEHGESAPDHCSCPAVGFHREILTRLASSGKSRRQGKSQSCQVDGVFDIASLISSNRREKNILEEMLRLTPGKHYLATHFFINDGSGVLLTVRASRPFTSSQKLTLSLLREHLIIAACRNFHSAPDTAHGPPSIDDTILTRREKEILPCLTQGMTNPEIAHFLSISPRTVEKHVASILDKSGLDNRRMLIGLNPTSTPPNTRIKNG